MSLTLAGATLGAAAVGGFGSLLSNLFGSKNQSSANATNIHLAQLNNQFNERMMQKQMDYNMMMWDKQNAYNTPAEQMKRLKAAGINPYMALGNVQSGQAGSAGGINPAQGTPARVEAFQPDFSGIGQAVQNYVSNRIMQDTANADIGVKNQQEEQLRIENQYKEAQLAAQVMELSERAKNWKEKNVAQRIENKYLDEQFSSDILESKRRSALIEQQTRSELINQAIQRVHLANLPRQYQLEFSAIMANTALAVAQEDLTMKQAKHELTKQFKTIAETTKQRLDNQLLMATFDDLVKEASGESRRANEPQNIWQGLIDFKHGFDSYVDDWIVRPSKKHWKETRRAFGF